MYTSKDLIDELSEPSTLEVTAHYPLSDIYDYEVYLERINLDEERVHDVYSNNGFIIDKKQNIKKDIKAENGIFSSKFGKTLQDANPFANWYKCKCGHYQGSIYEGLTCEYCHTKVKFVSDNFEYFGWICIDEKYCLIHPNLYKSLSTLIGPKEFDAILNSDDKIDEQGFIISPKPTSKNPYVGLGILGFRDKVVEIMDFFLKKNKKKKEFYDDIMKNMDKLFIHSIPVFTTQLRPFSVEDNVFTFEGNNAIYNTLAGQAMRINRNQLFAKRAGKPEKEILYSMQLNYMALYKDMEQQISQKKGFARSLIGGRYNFCARAVIIPEPDLEIDEISISYHSAIELFQQRIINILSKTMLPSEAYIKFEHARIEPNREFYDLMMNIIRSEFTAVIVNRNPSIWTKSIICSRIVKINFDNYACGLPLEILTGLNADFDGDALNISYITNEEYKEAAIRIFNPRYSGQISRNSGLFSIDVSHQTDTLICINSFAFMARDSYTQSNLEKIKACKNYNNNNK